MCTLSSAPQLITRLATSVLRALERWVDEMYGTTNIIFIVLAGVGALLVAIPLPKALASGNVGTSMLIVWTELACLVHFINAIRWNRNVENWVPGWCDFCGYFLVFVDIALVACSLSINRRLYMITTLNLNENERVYNMVIDFALCLVLPFASLALEYVVQQYRFFIYEDIGCLPGVGVIDLAFPLVWMLPLLVGTVSAGYACLNIRESFRQGYRMMEEPAVSSSWSWRLMAIGVLSVLYGLVPTSMAIALPATAYPVTSWPGWKAVHSTNDVILYVSVQEWRSGPIQIANAELRRWTIMSLAFVIFWLLGLTSDVKKIFTRRFKGFVQKTFSTDQTSNDQRECITFPNNQKYPRTLRFWRTLNFERSREQRRREGWDLNGRLRLDSDPGGVKLDFPFSRHGSHSRLSLKSHDKGDYSATHEQDTAPSVLDSV